MLLMSEPICVCHTAHTSDQSISSRLRRRVHRTSRLWMSVAVDLVHGQHTFLNLTNEGHAVRTTSKEACMELLRELTNVWAVPVGGSPLIESGGDMTNGGAEARISAKVGFPRSNK